MPTRRHALALSGAAGFALLCPARAFAHRVNRAESTVVFSGEDGRVEVTHIFHAADAQAALFKAGLIDKPDIANLRARARLALHVEETFGILINEEERPLTTLGAEIVGNNIYVYQEGTDFHPGQLHIRAAMLHGLLHGQRNSVTVEMGSERLGNARRGTYEMTKGNAVKEVVL